MDYAFIDKYINEILNGSTDLPKFNQPEHAGVCSAGPLLIGALTVCNLARESLEASSNAAGGERTPANWEIDEAQEKVVQQWAESKGWSDRLHLEHMHPAMSLLSPKAIIPSALTA